MAEVGYPIAEVDETGETVITKPAGTGGVVDRLTVIEQLLYEIHDPSAYLAPDVVLDLTDVEVAEIGKDRVRVSGAQGKPAPETLKATVCVDGGFLGEAEISYAGPNAAARAQLAAEVVRTRVRKRVPHLNVRVDAIGVRSVWGATVHADLRGAQTDDVRLRFAAESAERCRYRDSARRGRSALLRGTGRRGGVRRRITPRLASASCLIEKRFAEPRVTCGSAGMTPMVRLHDIANARTGDKGNRLNLVLVCGIPLTMRRWRRR